MRHDVQIRSSPPDMGPATLTKTEDPVAATTQDESTPKSTRDSPAPTNAAAADPLNNDEDYPEGGTQAWLVVLGAWCAMVPSMGFLNTLAVLEAWVSSNELPDLPPSTTGWIFSCYAFFLYFCGAQVGPIFDAHDIRFLIVPGVIGIVASVMCMSVSTEFWQLLLSFGVLGGMSASLLFNPSVSAIGHWFSKRRGLATGVACTAGGLGGVSFPLIIIYCSPRVGFGWALRIIGFISLALGVAACALLRKRLPPSKHARAAVDFGALRDRKFATTTVAVFLVEFAVFVPYTYICSYALHAGLGTRTAYLLNVFLNAGAVPGRILPGYVADRFGTFNTMCVTAAACTALIFALWLPSGGNTGAVAAFSVLYGFWSGAAISLTPVCIGAVCDVEDYGKRIGTAYCISSFGALTGIPIAGAILEASGGSYDGLILFAGALYAAALVAFVVARGAAGGWELRLVV